MIVNVIVGSVEVRSISTCRYGDVQLLVIDTAQKWPQAQEAYVIGCEYGWDVYLAATGDSENTCVEVRAETEDEVQLKMNSYLLKVSDTYGPVYAIVPQPSCEQEFETLWEPLAKALGDGEATS